MRVREYFVYMDDWLKTVLLFTWDHFYAEDASAENVTAEDATAEDATAGDAMAELFKRGRYYGGATRF